MLIDKYRADNIFRHVPGLTIKMNPELAVIDKVLDDDELCCLVRHDLARRYPQTECRGRKSTPVEVISRMLAVKHLYNFSYEETEQHVSDSLVLRQFCRVYFHTVPDHTTLWRWAQLIQPATLEAFNEGVLALAVAAKLTRGRKLRMDAMVVETNIHYPTDSSLLADGVRVLGRTLSRARALVGQRATLSRQAFRNRTRSAKRAAREVARLSFHGVTKTLSAYKRLVQTARATVRQATQVLTVLEEQPTTKSVKLANTLRTYVPRLQQVLEQTTRRLFAGESVPATEKLVSIFQPHTDVIRRGKPRHNAEFGHKVWLGEVEGGFIAQFEVLEGNPADKAQWQPTIERHLQQFGRPPWQVSADRGVHSGDNERLAAYLGVKRVILPKPGYKSQRRREHEKQRWFRRGRRFHAGVDGRISVISRKHGLDRCRNRRQIGFEQWVGWGVIANNLTALGRGLSP